MRKIGFATFGLWLVSAGWAAAQTGFVRDPGRAGVPLPYMGVVPGTLLWADSEPQPQGKKWSIGSLLRRKQPAAREGASGTENVVPPSTPPSAEESEPVAAETPPPAPKAATLPAAPPAPEPKAPPVLDAAIPPAAAAPAEAAAPPAPAVPLPDPSPQPIANDNYAPLFKWGPQTCTGHWWVSADYLFRWLKRDTAPGPLLMIGIPGTPGTTPLGNNSAFLNSGPFAGTQLTAGRRLGDGPYGVEFSGFMLEQRTTGQQAGSDATGNPAVTLPFINAANGNPDHFLVAYPGAYAGSATITNSARFWGGEANLSRVMFSKNNCYGQLLVGARYLNLEEQIGAQSVSVDIPPAGFGTFNGVLLPASSLVTTADNFSTQNNFYGTQVGGRMEWRYRAFFVQSAGKVALGITDQIVAINGFSSALPPGATTPMTAAGGLYAQPSNIGRANRTEFGVVPEFALTFGVQLTQRLRIYAGYNIIYWSNVVRPGGQINPVVNLAQPPLSSQFAPAPSPTQPLAIFHSSDFWAQGVDLGLSFRF